VLRDALVRPGGVVVRLVFGQDGMQVLLAEDQDAVQEFAAQGADEALAESRREATSCPRVQPVRSTSGMEDRGAPAGLHFAVELSVRAARA
jgi:hypothetical protein